MVPQSKSPLQKVRGYHHTGNSFCKAAGTIDNHFQNYINSTPAAVLQVILSLMLIWTFCVWLC